MRLPGSSFPEARGVDFWFRAEPLLSEPFGLLGKDRSLHHDGDINVFLMKDSGPDPDVNHVYVRVQYTGSGAEDLTTFTCSGPLTEAGWHHVALAFDGSLVTMFVDGQLANQQAPLGLVEPGQVCSDQILGRADGTLPSKTESDWVWGASNQFSDGPRGYFKGDLDSLRFRDDPFTSGEAQKIYNEVGQ